MSAEPDVAAIAALIGEPKRARMLSALIGGKALTATELARIADQTKQTTSAHLAKLTAGGLLEVAAQGRHRYFRLAGQEVARVLEGLFGLAAANDVDAHTGPREPALRLARICYDHLAGELAVSIFAYMERERFFLRSEQSTDLSPRGEEFMRSFGINLDRLSASRRPLCRACLDWSERRYHLAGALGAALLARLFELDWARPVRGSRAVIFSALGQMRLRSAFSLN
jgi:DNA-binding transcriptional ArsR family regulator